MPLREAWVNRLERLSYVNWKDSFRIFAGKKAKPFFYLCKQKLTKSFSYCSEQSLDPFGIGKILFKRIFASKNSYGVFPILSQKNEQNPSEGFCLRKKIFLKSKGFFLIKAYTNFPNQKVVFKTRVCINFSRSKNFLHFTLQ